MALWVPVRVRRCRQSRKSRGRRRRLPPPRDPRRTSWRVGDSVVNRRRRRRERRPSSSHPRGYRRRIARRIATGACVPAFVFGDAPDDSPCSTSAHFEDSGDFRGWLEDGGESRAVSPSPDPAGAVARALRATVRALDSVLGPSHPSINPAAGLKPFYDDEGKVPSPSPSPAPPARRSTTRTLVPTRRVPTRRNGSSRRTARRGPSEWRSSCRR